MADPALERSPVSEAQRGVLTILQSGARCICALIKTTASILEDYL